MYICQYIVTMKYILAYAQTLPALEHRVADIIATNINFSQ